MALVERMQVRMVGLVNAYIDRLMRALEPELRARFLHQDAAAKPRAPISLAKHTLESLGALDDTFRPNTLAGLRASEEFKATGRTSAAFDRVEHETGIRIAVEKGGNLVLRSGSHRFKVAKELDLDSIWGTVVDAETGRVLFVGHIPLKVFAQEAAPAIPAHVFETGEVSIGEAFLRSVFHQVDATAAADLQRVIPVPLERVLPNSRKLEQEWLRNNTDLIKLEERARREVEQVIADPLRQGQRVEVVREKIQERLGVVRSRAELIARDQTTKVYGQLQEARQRAAGITHYVWSTSLDERVRGTPGGMWPQGNHFDLEGTTQSWDDPPIIDPRTGERGHPGTAILCRCAAIPVLTDDLEGDE